jgi:ketosteroid isomerase-like protein
MMTLQKIASMPIAFAALVLFTSSTLFAHEGEHADGPFSSPEPAVTEINAVLTGYASEIAKSNVKGMATYVIQSDAFSIIEGSHANWGWVDYRDNHLKPEFSSDKFKITAFSISDIRVSVAGDVAYATFNSRIEYTLDGEAKSNDGMDTAILVKTDDGWRIRHMHS